MSTKKCRHTPQPKGYIAWHEWAAKKSKTHRQIRCKGCGRLEVWTRKASR